MPQTMDSAAQVERTVSPLLVANFDPATSEIGEHNFLKDLQEPVTEVHSTTGEVGSHDEITDETVEPKYNEDVEAAELGQQNLLETSKPTVVDNDINEQLGAVNATELMATTDVVSTDQNLKPIAVEHSTTANSDTTYSSTLEKTAVEGADDGRKTDFTPAFPANNLESTASADRAEEILATTGSEGVARATDVATATNEKLVSTNEQNQPSGAEKYGITVPSQTYNPFGSTFREQPSALNKTVPAQQPVRRLPTPLQDGANTNATRPSNGIAWASSLIPLNKRVDNARRSTFRSNSLSSRAPNNNRATPRLLQQQQQAVSRTAPARQSTVQVRHSEFKTGDRVISSMNIVPQGTMTARNSIDRGIVYGNEATGTPIIPQQVGNDDSKAWRSTTTAIIHPRNDSFNNSGSFIGSNEAPRKSPYNVQPELEWQSLKTSGSDADSKSPDRGMIDRGDGASPETGFEHLRSTRSPSPLSARPLARALQVRTQMANSLEPPPGLAAPSFANVRVHSGASTPQRVSMPAEDLSTLHLPSDRQLRSKLMMEKRALARQQVMSVLFTKLRLTRATKLARQRCSELDGRLKVVSSKLQAQQEALHESGNLVQNASESVRQSEWKARRGGREVKLREAIAALHLTFRERRDRSRSRIAQRVHHIRDKIERKVNHIVDTASRLIQIAREQSFRTTESNSLTNKLHDETVQEFPHLSAFLHRYFGVISVRTESPKQNETVVPRELGYGSSRVASNFSSEHALSHTWRKHVAASYASRMRNELRFGTGVNVKQFYESIVKDCSLLSRRWRALLDRNCVLLKKVKGALVQPGGRGSEWRKVAVYFAKYRASEAVQRTVRLNKLLSKLAAARMHPPCRVVGNSPRSAMALWTLAPLLGRTNSQDFRASARNRVPQRLVLVRPGPENHGLDRLVASKLAATNDNPQHFGTLWCLGVAHMLLRLPRERANS